MTIDEKMAKYVLLANSIGDLLADKNTTALLEEAIGGPIVEGVRDYSNISEFSVKRNGDVLSVTVSNEQGNPVPATFKSVEYRYPDTEVDVPMMEILFKNLITLVGTLITDKEAEIEPFLPTT